MSAGVRRLFAYVVGLAVTALASLFLPDDTPIWACLVIGCVVTVICYVAVEFAAYRGERS